MPNLFSLSWRLLLIAALVFNPVAGAAAMLATELAQAAAPAAADDSATMPPCHEMAPEVAVKAPATPVKHHGDCGNAACQFAACCAVGALDLSTPIQSPSMFLGVQLLPSLYHLLAEAPPPARMIRPPIS